MQIDYICHKAGYNRAEPDGINFSWVTDNYLFLYFTSYARVGKELVPPGTALMYAPGEQRDYGSCGGFVNSHLTFTISREIFLSFNIKSNFAFSPYNGDAINKLMKKITHEKNNSRPMGESMLLGLTLQLLTELGRAQAAVGEDAEKELQLRKRFEKIREEYISDLVNPPELEELIAEEFFSRSSFYRLYKRFFGSAPKNDLTLARLACAKDLLIKTKLSTAKIAAISGFGSALNLYRCFRSYAGCTVKEWKDKNAPPT